MAAVRTDTDIPSKYMIEKVGYGAGKRDYEVPSMLRAMLIDSEQHNVKDLSDTQTRTVYISWKQILTTVQRFLGTLWSFSMKQVQEKYTIFQYI